MVAVSLKKKYYTKAHYTIDVSVMDDFKKIHFTTQQLKNELGI